MGGRPSLRQLCFSVDNNFLSLLGRILFFCQLRTFLWSCTTRLFDQNIFVVISWFGLNRLLNRLRGSSWLNFFCLLGCNCCWSSWRCLIIALFFNRLLLKKWRRRSWNLNRRIGFLKSWRAWILDRRIILLKRWRNCYFLSWRRFDRRKSRLCLRNICWRIEIRFRNIRLWAAHFLDGKFPFLHAPDLDRGRIFSLWSFTVIRHTRMGVWIIVSLSFLSRNNLNCRSLNFFLEFIFSNDLLFYYLSYFRLMRFYCFLDYFSLFIFLYIFWVFNFRPIFFLFTFTLSFYFNWIWLFILNY